MKHPFALLLPLLVAWPAAGQVGPSTGPATRPGPAAVAVGTPLGPITPAGGPVAVPFTLSPTNHLIVRLKINGHGPFNFIVDTGAPTLFVDEGVARQIGLRPDPAPQRVSKAFATTHPATTRLATTGPVTARRPAARPPAQGWATIDRLDVEGGLSIAKVKCLVMTPYQITGMNAVGVAGVELHGLLGYSVLARFKLDVDLSRHRMLWTPQPPGFVPPPITASDRDASSGREEGLESMGGVMRILGPLLRSQMPGSAVPRGWVGVELTESPGPSVNGVPARGSVSVAKVYAGGPAALAGLRAGDPIFSVGGHEVHTIAEAEACTSHLLPGQRVILNVGPASSTTKTTERTEGDTRTTVTTVTTVSRMVTVTCGEGL